jgi:hypothetical protein
MIKKMQQMWFWLRGVERLRKRFEAAVEETDRHAVIIESIRLAYLRGDDVMPGVKQLVADMDSESWTIQKKRLCDMHWEREMLLARALVVRAEVQKIVSWSAEPLTEKLYDLCQQVEKTMHATCMYAWGSDTQWIPNATNQPGLAGDERG